MSADLLRRAATRLRESALAAQEIAPPSWRYGCEDYIPNRALLANDGTLTVATVYEVSELPALSDYLTCVHPPVALALADWLDAEADREQWAGPGRYAVAVARAVLREPEGGETP
jgi:hypothetical protein